MPRVSIAVVLIALIALASTMTYIGFLVVGVLADYLGVGRVAAGLLLGAVFARFPWIGKGKLRIVGLLPKIVRRPAIVSLLALCLVHFLSRGENVSAGLMVFATIFLLTLPRVRRAIFGRLTSSVFQSTAGRNRTDNADGTVIDVEFKEKKD